MTERGRGTGPTRRGALVGLGAALVGCAGPRPRAEPTPTGLAWGAPQAPTVVALVPTLGFGPRVFDLPGVGGLAPALARAGHRVHALAGVEAEAGALAARLRALRGEGRRLFGVGHGWGGAQLLGAVAAGAPVDGLILIGAPLAFGGEQRAVRALWARRPARWGDLPAPLARRLLTVGLPERVRAPLLAHAATPLTATLDAWRRRAAGRVVPAPDGGLEALARFAGPALCVSSPTDALFPPHVCDPAAFGPPPPRAQHRLIAPVDGAALRYGHLDLVAHPAARSSLDPLFEAWLADHRDPAGPSVAGLFLESEAMRR